MKKNGGKKLAGLLLTGVMVISGITGYMPATAIQFQSVKAAGFTEYPAELVRISTRDNSRNLNISGSYDGALLNTAVTNGSRMRTGDSIMS